MLYKNLPRAVGLRRITLHKTINLKKEVVYLLLVECSHFLNHINEAANLLPVLRARICGYTGIFRCVDHFWPQPPLPKMGSEISNEQNLAKGKIEENIQELPSPQTAEKSGFWSSLIFGKSSSWQYVPQKSLIFFCWF